MFFAEEGFTWRGSSGRNVVLSDAAPTSISGTASSAGTSEEVARADHVHFHGELAGGLLHAIATAALAGFMSAADKSKLDSFLALVYADTTADTDGAVTVASTVTIGRSAFANIGVGGRAQVTVTHPLVTATSVIFTQKGDPTLQAIRRADIHVQNGSFVIFQSAGGAAGDYVFWVILKF